MSHGPLVQREVDPPICAGRRAPVSPAVGAEMAEEVGTEVVGLLAEAGLSNESQGLALLRRRHGDKRRTGRRITAMIARGHCSTQILGGDQGGVPAVVQQIGEYGAQPGVPLSRGHHPGGQRIEQAVDQRDPVPSPSQRIVSLIVPGNCGIESQRRQSPRPRRCHRDETGSAASAGDRMQRRDLGLGSPRVGNSGSTFRQGRRGITDWL